MAEGPGKFVVLHTLVGIHKAGSVIEITKDNIEKLGVDVGRLLTLQAVRKATPEEAKDSTPYGVTDDEEIPVPFPTVPFEATRNDVPSPVDTVPTSKPQDKK